MEARNTENLSQTPLRSLAPAQVKSKEDVYPQTPMQVKIGPWDAGFEEQEDEGNEEPEVP